MTKKQNDIALEQWKRKRRDTTIISMFHVFIFAVENRSLFFSLPSYLKDNFQTDENLPFIFGIITGAEIVGQFIGNVMFGRLNDATKNTRLIIIMNLSLAVLGNALYMIPYSIWILCLSKLLCGLNESIQSTMCGKNFYETMPQAC